MLTAEQVNQIINYDETDLTQLIQKLYPTDEFLTARFLGLSNTGLFVFSATWHNPDNECDETVKVFVESEDGVLTADY